MFLFAIKATAAHNDKYTAVRHQLLPCLVSPKIHVQAGMVIPGNTRSPSIHLNANTKLNRK